MRYKFSNKIDFNIPDEYKTSSGIYMITNNKTDKIYIGRTKNFFNRYKEHANNITYGYCNFKFKTLMLLYPDIEFTMKLVEITQDIINREEFYIQKYNCVNTGLNIITKDSEFYDKDSKRVFRNSLEYAQYKKLLKEKGIKLSNHKKHHKNSIVFKGKILKAFIKEKIEFRKCSISDLENLTILNRYNIPKYFVHKIYEYENNYYISRSCAEDLLKIDSKQFTQLKITKRIKYIQIKKPENKHKADYYLLESILTLCNSKI